MEMLMAVLTATISFYIWNKSGELPSGNSRVYRAQLCTTECVDQHSV